MQIWYKIMLSGFGVGWLPLAPGTWGAALAILIISPLLYVQSPTPALVLIGLSLVFTAIGVKGSALMESEWGKDPKQTVIDEMVGVWVALVGLQMNWTNFLLAFVLFRFFDIAKPLGIRRMERFGNGWGVMLDDILAGIYANIVLQSLLVFF